MDCVWKYGWMPKYGKIIQVSNRPNFIPGINRRQNLSKKPLASDACLLKVDKANLQSTIRCCVRTCQRKVKVNVVVRIPNIQNIDT